MSYIREKFNINTEFSDITFKRLPLLYNYQKKRTENARIKIFFHSIDVKDYYILGVSSGFCCLNLKNH